MMLVNNKIILVKIVMVNIKSFFFYYLFHEFMSLYFIIASVIILFYFENYINKVCDTF